MFIINLNIIWCGWHSPRVARLLPLDRRQPLFSYLCPSTKGRWRMALRFFTAYRRLLLRLLAFASSHRLDDDFFFLPAPSLLPPPTLLHFVGLVEVTNELDRERANSLMARVRSSAQPMNGDFLNPTRFADGVLYVNYSISIFLAIDIVTLLPFRQLTREWQWPSIQHS